MTSWLGRLSPRRRIFVIGLSTILAAVLAVVAWNMVEKEEFAGLLRSSWGDAGILLVTFLLTLFADLVLAIAAGVTLGALQFLHRMAEAVEVVRPYAVDVASGVEAQPGRKDHAKMAAFFEAANSVGATT